MVDKKIAKRDRPQSAKFIDAAREIGADDGESTLRNVMRELAKKPPKLREKPKSDKQ